MSSPIAGVPEAASMPAVAYPSTLRNLALFAGLADEQVDTINRRIRKHNYASGTYVITAETPGEAVYITLSGTVKIKVDQADGKEVIIAILGPGAIVGQICALVSATRTADAMTQEATA